MSRVTNVVLMAANAQSDALDPFLDEVQRWKYGVWGPYPLVSLADTKLPRQWFGGNSTPLGAFAIGALNHLAFEPYLAFLRSLCWERLGCHIQLAVLGEEDEAFRLYPIYPPERAEPDVRREQALADIAALLPPVPPDQPYSEAGPLSERELAAMDDAVLRYLATRGIRVHRRPMTGSDLS